MPPQGGSIVVDGVLASAHSSWVLDGVTPASLRRHLPAVYQAAFKPLVLAYRALGPARMAAATDAVVPHLLDLDLARALRLGLAGALLLAAARAHRGAAAPKAKAA